MDATKRPSEEQMWAGPSGERWLASATAFEETLRSIGDALIELAKFSPGEHVIDVGCGAGSMSLDIAGRVAPNGSVVGLDISPALISEAARRAAAAQPKSAVEFIVGDAARAALPRKADCLVSRFGCMFFTDPYAAFVHMHSLVRPGGRIALACWTTMKQNPWMFEMRSIMGTHFELPVIPPRTPGPFAFAETDYLRDILAKADFQCISISPWDGSMFVGGPGSDPVSATEFLFKALSIAQRAIDAPEEVRNKVKKELTNRLAAFMTPGGVRMPASAWLVTAQA